MGCEMPRFWRLAARCHEVQRVLRDVTILKVAERCREAEGGLRDVTILNVGCEMSRGSRWAERCHEAEGGL